MSDEQLDKSKILLVEDEENLALGLEYNLTEEGYEVILARDGKQAIKFFDENNFDEQTWCKNTSIIYIFYYP